MTDTLNRLLAEKDVRIAELEAEVKALRGNGVQTDCKVDTSGGCLVHKRHILACETSGLRLRITVLEAEVAALKDQNHRIAEMRIEDCERAEEAKRERDEAMGNLDRVLDLADQHRKKVIFAELEVARLAAERKPLEERIKRLTVALEEMAERRSYRPESLRDSTDLERNDIADIADKALEVTDK